MLFRVCLAGETSRWRGKSRSDVRDERVKDCSFSRTFPSLHSSGLLESSFTKRIFLRSVLDVRSYRPAYFRGWPECFTILGNALIWWSLSPRLASWGWRRAIHMRFTMQSRGLLLRLSSLRWCQHSRTISPAAFIPLHPSSRDRRKLHRRPLGNWLLSSISVVASRMEHSSWVSYPMTRLSACPRRWSSTFP